ncbi:hypothetical protein A6M27_01235 [Acidithiobacillus thiooxidans]|uniref:Uncharacterized protein n=2 Tax=Acidithiobacillus thiooxidans TaxID=930 RepID=A0A1C2JFI8_ACITH|nr:hypothetical protein [Acidithiobacillus thiooxidans]OCX71323.1 hypothetical protein A6O24_15495 [Acidithiobacillus thiooxidans]OCX72484.1 hypothetical protein A6P07_09805 [Acidithiobacillus thiooxidans]OCX74739.1 hypothetical protein A6M23_05060 [Acidithiobacillus thiooxidans]OCX83008.1 hypothetical protein A6O26_08225 [Acidithiobacillus thiooxidans]OCX86954.1 hypothetical protein A6P08_04590 [Acidithiobacillus thiooxidans]
MTDDLWKILYRIYIIAVFVSGAVITSYLLLQVGYTPGGFDGLWRISAPGVIAFAPIAVLVTLPAVIPFALGIKIKIPRGSLTNLRFWKDSLISLILIGYCASIFYLVGWGLRVSIWPEATGYSAIKENLVATLIAFLFFTLIWMIIKEQKFGADNKIFLMMLPVLVAMGAVEYHWVGNLLALERVATLGYGRITLTVKDYSNIFLRSPYGVSCVPAFYRLDRNTFVLLDAKLLYDGQSQSIVKYWGFINGLTGPIGSVHQNINIVDNDLCVNTIKTPRNAVYIYSDDDKNPAVLCKDNKYRYTCSNLLRRLTIGPKIESILRQNMKIKTIYKQLPEQ